MVDKRLSQALKDHKDVPDEIVLNCKIYNKATIHLKNNGITRRVIPVKWNTRLQMLNSIMKQVYKKYKELGIWQ